MPHKANIINFCNMLVGYWEITGLRELMAYKVYGFIGL